MSASTVRPSRPLPRARRHLARLLAVSVLAASLTAVSTAPAAAAPVLPDGFTAVSTPVAKGALEVAYAPDGRVFVAEKAGLLRVVRPDGSTKVVLNLSARVNSYSDRGLLGLALDKDFATNGWLYLLYSQELAPATPDGSGAMTAVLTRVTVNADSTLADPLAPETVILGKDGGTPCPVPDGRDCLPADHYWHVIGTVRSDPVDGTLWVGSGDAHAHVVDELSYRPYDENSTAGKILHVGRDGRGLAGHPFCPAETDTTRTCTKVYAKGFRNPFRFHLRPGLGPVVGDVGFGQQEEIDLVQAGRNYGWPCYEGTARTSLYSQTPTCLDLYAQEGAATPPAWSYPHAGGAAVVAGPVYTGTSYPADMHGDVFVGDYVQGWVKRLDLGAGDTVTGVTDFIASGWGGVSLAAAPTGDIADVDIGYASGTPAVRRYAYTSAGNGTPVARATASTLSGSAPLTVDFDGSTSTDPDGDALTYAWSFGDGGTSTAVAPSHSYVAEGSYGVTLTVRDAAGASSSAQLTVRVSSGAAPTVEITAPAAGATYRDGVRVDLTALASDAEDGPLSGDSVSWEVLLHHGTHLHQVGTFTGTSTSFVPLVDHDADSSYELRVTATDSSGATATATRDIHPETAPLTLASDPPGAVLTYEGEPLTAPSTRTVAVGFSPQVGAADTVVVDGVTHRFSSWSDGGTQRHSITMPPGGTTLTATYVPEATPPTEDLVFRPTADTYVMEAYPTTAYGSSSKMRVDASPIVQSLVKFDVSGLAGRPVTGVRLRLHQTDASDSGGRLRAVGNAWTESTTWSTRPAVGDVLASLPGPVSAGNWYEAALPAGTVSADGVMSLALDTLSGDGASWASRTTLTPAELVVTVGTGEAPEPPPTETLTFTATKDTFVDEKYPTRSYGGSAKVVVDGSPRRRGLVGFDVAGLAGRTVTGVVLRMHQADASRYGGRVFAVPGPWDESTTWNTRPALGSQLATVTGPVAAGTWYDTALPLSALQEGPLSFGLTTPSSDGIIWTSRSTSTPPQLIVTVSGESQPAPPPPVEEQLVFTASQDTSVRVDYPTTSYGGSSRLQVDASPVRQSLVGFDVSGLAGRTITGVELRLHQLDASGSGGRVLEVLGPWSEATTWNDRPPYGSALATIPGPVSAGRWYTAELPRTAVPGEGLVSFALDTPSADGILWASRSTATPPQLVVTVAAG